MKKENENRKLNTTEVLEICQHGIIPITGQIKIVGSWIWIEYVSKPDGKERDFLKEVGFFYNKTRNCWQHCCGVFRKFNRRCDPKAVYGERDV